MTGLALTYMIVSEHDLEFTYVSLIVIRGAFLGAILGLILAAFTGLSRSLVRNFVFHPCQNSQIL